LICPACHRGLPAGPHERCPFCASLLSAPVEGALAAEPLPEALRGRVEPLREIPGLRKRERTWKDEVRERVHHRRQQRAGQEDLPLFTDEGAEEEGASVEGDPEPMSSAPAPTDSPELLEGDPLAGGDEPAAIDDLPLRSRAGGSPVEPMDEDPEPAPSFARSEAWPELPDPAPRPFSLGAEAGAEHHEPGSARPLERPARPGERTQAAMLDLALLAALSAVVVYFASRAAHVSVSGLRPAALYLAAYLGALGLIYAGYFTGTTGQTLGKMLLGLRVVDAGGRPPGYLRASLRALFGSAGIVLVFAGVAPVFFDPARRGLHDRLLKTRVIKG
jgi:uncharacterized RDD family membrane protein YckC